MKLIHSIIFIISFFYSYSQPSQDSLIEDRSLLDSVNHVYIPKNLAECFTQLDLCLNDSARLRYMNLKEDDLAWFHFGLGMQLRNKWVLWGGSRLAKFFNETGIYHADDMSSIILLSYHRILNCKDIGLEEQGGTTSFGRGTKAFIFVLSGLGRGKKASGSIKKVLNVF